MLTADGVRDKRFTVTKFREGYEQSDVDNLLQRVASTLEGRGGQGAVAPDDVSKARFRPTKLSAGYDQDEVDDFLDLVVTTLRAMDGGPARVPADKPAAQAKGHVPILLRVLQVTTAMLFLVGLGLFFVDAAPYGVAFGLMVVSSIGSVAVQLFVFHAENQPRSTT